MKAAPGLRLALGAAALLLGFRAGAPAALAATPAPTHSFAPELPSGSAWAYAAPPKPVSAAHGAVASVSGVASAVGVDVLKAGGNAVDAAVAVAFALAVVYPEAGNVGGGGFMLIQPAGKTPAALDYRETAPERASERMYLDARGNLTERSLVGSLAAGVPGTVAGLEAAHRRYGKLPWARLVAPAVRLASEGFTVNGYLARTIARSDALISRFPETKRLLMPGGKAPAEGDVLRFPELADTLRRIAAEGADGFYRGPVAEAIAADQARTGGLISRRDLESYRAKWRAPVRATYRGHTIWTMPLPSSGGVTVAEIANILEGYDLAKLGFHSPAHVHLMIEAERRAYADRNAYLGDPDFVEDIPLEKLMSKDYAAERREGIRLDRATPEAHAPGLGEPEHTTHFSVVDAEGNAVSNTYTLNGNFGCGVTVPGTGVLLNNEMDDFAAKPGTPNLFGLVQGRRNAIAPGKRMLSSMTPAVAWDPQGRFELAWGSPGGSTIITTVFQVFSGMVDFHQPLEAAIAAPRVHHQGLPDVLQIEPNALPASTIAALRAMGHAVEPRDYIGDAMGVARAPGGGLSAVADPRRGGAAAGY